MVYRAKAGIDIAAKAARFVPLGSKAENKPALDAIVAPLCEGDRKALEYLVKAAHIMDDLYLVQEWEGCLNMRKELEKQGDELLLRYFNINEGPWDRLEENEVWLEGAPARNPGAGYYPADMTKEEFETWIATLDGDERANATGYYHVIRRNADGSLRAVPFSEEYAEFLQPAAQLLKDAAEHVSDASLAHFLRLRAESFLTNEYVESDMAWMDVSKTSKLDITIGPYEVYSDALFGYKAAFRAFIAVRDPDATQKLAQFSSCMQELEDNLPIPAEHKNKLGDTLPIVVVNELLVAGDRAGPQTAAFNLPNNPPVIKAKGTKMVIIKNVQERKFDNILRRISDTLIHPDQRQYIAFDSFFTHILAHEMCHGLGPHTIKKDGRVTSVGLELQEHHSNIDEAKADIAGLWGLQYLMDHGKMDKNQEKSFYVTFLASQFRSVRFGMDDAHGAGHALLMHYILEKGAYNYHADTGCWSVNFDKIADAVRDACNAVMMVQALGDKQMAADMLAQRAVITPEVARSLDQLKHARIPVDIEAIQLL